MTTYLKQTEDPIAFMGWFHSRVEATWLSIVRSERGGRDVPSMGTLLSWLMRDYMREDGQSEDPPGWPTTSAGRLTAGLGADINKWGIYNFSKRCYIAHPSLVGAVAGSVDDDTRVPGEALRAMPHDEALIALPEPISFWSELDGRQEWYQYVLMCGRIERPGEVARLCQTSNPHATGVSLTFLGYAIIPADEARQYARIAGRDDLPLESSTYVLPTRYTLSFEFSRTCSIEDAARELAGEIDRDRDSTEVRTAFGGARRSSASQSQSFGEILPLLKMGIGLALYIASQDVDLSERPKPRNKSAARREAKEGVKRYDLGYRIGPQIDAASKPRSGATGEHSGRTVSPHIRRGHFHTVAYGPGRTMRRVRWFAPIAVNKDKSQPADVVTLHGLGNRR